MKIGKNELTILVWMANRTGARRVFNMVGMQRAMKNLENLQRAGLVELSPTRRHPDACRLTAKGKQAAAELLGNFQVMCGSEIAREAVVSTPHVEPAKVGPAWQKFDAQRTCRRCGNIVRVSMFVCGICGLSRDAQ